MAGKDMSEEERKKKERLKKLQEMSKKEMAKNMESMRGTISDKELELFKALVPN
tara:strand:+ start:16811 stop:16972 length:162 start_codon:yes stop_codon:yes gene_type:complete